MSTNKRIAWENGMLLSEKHFTKQESLLKAEIGLLNKLQHPHNWGLADLSIDHDALLFKKYIITSVRGILNDYSYFHYTLEQGYPLELACEDYTHAAPLSIYLSPSAKMIELELEEITIYENQLQLTALPPASGPYLKIAEIKIGDSGEFRVNPAYLPPSFFLKIHPSFEKKRLEIVTQLSAHLKAIGATNPIKKTWLLHYMDVLSSEKSTHPFFLYECLKSIMTHQTEQVINTPYQHDRAGPLLNDIIENVLHAMQTIKIPYQEISLKKDPYYWHTPLIQKSKKILIGLPELNGKAISQALIKVAPSSIMDTLIHHALPGVTLIPLQDPPKIIQTKEARHYYQCSIDPMQWEDTLETGSIAIHIASTDIKEAPRLWIVS